MAPKIIVIAGPTASGKTALSIALAKRFGGEVVSADSMQIYRRMDIGTAKPTFEERDGIPHHMLDVADPEESFSVARYVDMASACVDDILARGKMPIVAGGTGLYIDSLLSGRTFAPFPSSGWRERLQARAKSEGIGVLMEELRQIDPQAAGRLHLNDEKRIIRALEVWHETGKTITRHNEETAAIPPRYEGCRIGLNFARRSDLWQRIDCRVDEMMAQGLLAEVQSLLRSGIDPGCTSMQAIGYKELADAARGLAPVETAVEVGEIFSGHLPPMKNKPDFFGNQFVMNTDDEVMAVEERLLIGATDLDLAECTKIIREHGGAAVPAHINRGHGLLVNLGLFPDEPDFPVVEVRPELPVNEKLIAGKRRLWSSDAHHLGDILEAVSELEPDRFSLGGLFEYIDIKT